MTSPPMPGAASATILSPDTLLREGFDDPARGDASWFTLFSADRTATKAMSAGVMVLPPGGGRLEPHRHEQPEIYFVAAGAGVLTVDGTESAVTAGMAAFIPGNAEHSIRNGGAAELRVFYVFPADSFGEVAYRFPDPAG